MRKFTLVLLLLCALASPAWGAVAIDTSTNSGLQAGVSSYNFTITITGTNLCLLVGISIDATQTVSSITAVKGAVDTAMTLIGTITADGANVRSSLYQLVAPDTGVNTVKVTLSAAADSVTGAVSFTGVNQSTPVGASFTNSGGINTNPSTTVTDGSTTGWTMDVVSVGRSLLETYAADASQAEQWNVALGSAKSVGTASTEVGAASVVMSGTIGSPNNALTGWSQVAVAILAAAGGVPERTKMGVGQ